MIAAAALRGSARRVIAAIALPALVFALWWMLSDGSTSFYWPPLRKILASFGTTWSSRLTTDVLPTALPYILTGLRLSAAVALILAITAELVIGSPGLGHEIGVAMMSSAVPAMYALIGVVGMLGVAVNLGVRALERRALAWHLSVRTEAAA